MASASQGTAPVAPRPRDEEAALDAFVRCGGSLTETAAALKFPLSTVHIRVRDVRRYLRHKRDRNDR